jgi:2,4-dienoyl-CoA reductase-like NADH-dependent reductase (Old Yellow Enzyme family)
MLFESFTVNGMALRNRIVLAPLWLAVDGQSDLFRAFYVRRAEGGAGLVIAPQSTAGGMNDWLDPDFGQGFRPLIDGCHDAGARIALQVFPGIEDVCTAPVETLQGVPDRFARAAAGVQQAGFDAIDIHGAHHSPFMRLLSPFRNERTDRYGGSPEDCWRLQVDTVKAIRAAVGEDYAVLYRLSATDFRKGGIDLDLTVPFAQALEEAGVDCLDISAGTSDSPAGSSHPDKSAPFGCFADLAAEIRAVVGVSVIAVGKISTRDVAEYILEQRQADLVALGRPLIADPDWPQKLYDGRDDEIVPCLWDNVGCLRDSIAKGEPIRCIQNAEVGFEHESTDR